MLLLEDRALLDGFRRGDASALTRVYTAYSDDVARYLASLSLSALDLESAHQETFVRAFREESRLLYDGLRPYKPLLLAIARSVAVSLLRSSGKLAREAVPLDDSPQALDLRTENPSPEEQALQAEIKAVVSGFLSQLAPGDRELARVRFVDGVSQEKAAEELELTRAEVRTREKRLRKAFTRHLSQSGWLEKGRPVIFG